MTPPLDDEKRNNYQIRSIISTKNSREGSACELKDDAIDEGATEEYDSELSEKKTDN